VSKGKESCRRRSSLLPEEVRDSEARLTASMHLYSQRCDNLGVSSVGGCSSLLPEEVRDSEARLTASMHLYSQRCDNLGVAIMISTPELWIRTGFNADPGPITTFISWRINSDPVNKTNVCVWRKPGLFVKFPSIPCS
jgi:hypothetical protein